MADENTYHLLRQLAVEDEQESCRSTALEALANTWKDDDTRHLLKQRAVQDEHESPRRAALEALANTWPDDNTRHLLKQRAVQDGHESLRRAALKALTKTWPDNDTRLLLKQRAVEDEYVSLRRVALQVLVKIWPDGDTHRLLSKCAFLVDFAAYRLGKEHSCFGEVVFTQNLDGVSPYLDPRQPIPRDHLEKAAEKANVPPEQLDETVQSLSAHLGWDITVGSQPLSEDCERGEQGETS